MAFYLHRTDHHSRWREHPSSARRGCTEGRGADHQQRHADRRQAQVPLHAAHAQSNRAFDPADSRSYEIDKNKHNNEPSLCFRSVLWTTTVSPQTS